MIKLISLVEDSPLELLKIYEGQQNTKLEKALFRSISSGKTTEHYIRKEGYEIIFKTDVGHDAHWFAADKFITLAEFRQKQIDNLLNETN